MNFLTRTGRRQSYTLYLQNNPFWTPCNVYKTRSDISQGKPQTIHGAGGCTLILQVPLPEDGGSWRASPALELLLAPDLSHYSRLEVTLPPRPSGEPVQSLLRTTVKGH